MDELDFDGKKYLSSKRAAEVTGYAKDYVGQLCREGRVDARLVGRAWYVSESSIREHRFGGSNETVPEVEIETTKLSVAEDDPRVFQKKEVANTWGTSTYAPEAMDLVPTLHTRMSVDVFSEERASSGNSSVHHMQEVWQEWFDTKKEVSDATVLQEVGEVEDREEIPVTAAEVEVPVYKIPMHEPAHKVSGLDIERVPVPKESTISNTPRVQPVTSPAKKFRAAGHRSGGANIFVQALLVAFMLLVASLTLIALGYGDTLPVHYDISLLQYVTGVSK